MNAELTGLASSAREAAKLLANASAECKNAALLAIARALEENQFAILAANGEDVERARQGGTSPALIDRLLLNEKRILDMAEGVRQLVGLKDPIGERMERIERPNGLVIEKIRVPLGVIGMIYEARPNVTVDAASIALKSGNAILLRGSSSAISSNAALVSIMRTAIEGAGLDPNAICLVAGGGHGMALDMMRLNGFIDVIIPRGGASLIKSVVENSTVPVIETGIGNCHVFVDATANYAMAERIILNAKLQRPAVCNAMESLLIADKWGEENARRLLGAISASGVAVHGDARVLALCPEALPATEEDWGREYLALDLSAAFVADADHAIAHINRYGTHHSEAIVTEDPGSAEKFLCLVDAAAVYHNASTRYTDGFEFGFGAEIGISTQKLHARGPLGLNEMTSYKYVIRGSGQTR